MVRGGASYNPFALHNAGVEMQTATPGSLDKHGYDWDSAVTTQALPGSPVEVTTPGVQTGVPAAAAPNDLLAMAGMTFTAEATAQTNTQSADLKAELAKAEAAAWQGGKTPAQQAANIRKIESLREKIKKAEEKAITDENRADEIKLTSELSMDEHGNWFNQNGEQVDNPNTSADLQLASEQNAPSADAELKGSPYEKLTEKQKQIKAYEKYMQGFYPDYKYGGNNLGTKYNNPHGVDASKQAVREAAEVETMIGAGKALGWFARRTWSAQGALLELLGETRKRNYLDPSYVTNPNSEK